MLGSCGVLFFVLLHLRASCERDASGNAASADQRMQAMMMQMVSQMKSTQELVVDRLQAEAMEALSFDSTASEVQMHKSRIEHARQLDAHLATLKASLDPAFTYSHFKEAADKLNKDGGDIEKNMQSILGILPDLKAKSEEYQHKNFQLSSGVQKFEQGSVPALTRALGTEVKRSIKDIEGVDFRQAFTKEQEKLAEQGIKDTMSPIARMIKYGEVPEGEQIKVGHDPYADMSKNGYLPGLGQSVDDELKQGPTINFVPTDSKNRLSGLKSENYSSLVEIHPRNFVAASGEEGK
jgi:hypothetical protein